MSKTFKDYLEESGLQYILAKHGEYMKRAAKAGREGANGRVRSY